jgi:G:T/U-mismatch repair DNA glycosylase
MANPETDTGIISVGLEYDSDLGACTVWIDDIVAVENDTAEWTTLDRRNWKIDKEARDLILVRDGHEAVNYSLMKITGGDKPALMTSDSDTTEIDEDYVISQAVTLALLATSGGPGTDPDARRQLSAFWSEQATRARRAFPMLANVRSVD